MLAEKYATSQTKRPKLNPITIKNGIPLGGTKINPTGIGRKFAPPPHGLFHETTLCLLI